MAINANTVYTTVLSILNKEQRGYLTPDEFNPENSLSFSRGNLKHLPFLDERRISSSLFASFIPIK